MRAGVAVSIPEYVRLKEMQGKALKLDRVMKQLMQKMGPEKLKARHKMFGQYLVDAHRRDEPQEIEVN